MSGPLLVGTAELEITPPVGTMMAGSLKPRPSQGITAPLYLKAIVLESGGVRMAYAIFDLAVLVRSQVEPAVQLAAAATGIPADNIVWSCTHTHSGPCTIPHIFPSGTPDGVDLDWLGTLPARFRDCIAAADAAKVPARVSRARDYAPGLAQNRRLRFKDGREINTWLLNAGEEDVQCLGAAGPIDPEIGILSFETMDGTLLAVLFHYTLHANVHFGSTFCGDYPAVVASRLRERFGPQVATLFLPGACGDVNHVGLSYRAVGDALANRIIPRLERRTPMDGPVPIGIARRTETYSVRDWRPDQEARLIASQWAPDVRDFFRGTLADIRKSGITQAESIQHAWHIGDVAFAGLPGEAFIGLGIRVKQESPFPWTYPVELCDDWLGYLITAQAWEGGGYESLIASTGLIDVAGCSKMVDVPLEMLVALRERVAAT